MGEIACAACGYPITADLGDQVECPSCHGISEAIAGVTIPTPLFFGTLGFALGVLLAPTILAIFGVKELKRRGIIGSGS